MIAAWLAVAMVGFGSSSNQHVASTALPELEGPYSVGRASFDWKDDRRDDPLAPTSGVKREVTVWIWYPAVEKAQATPSKYLPPAWREALLQNQPSAIRNMSRDPDAVRCNSFEGVSVAADQRTFPVVLMKPGFGSLALQYTALCEDLASRGYFVVASDSPYNTSVVVYPDGRVVRQAGSGDPDENRARKLLKVWVDDDRFLLDRLSRLNKGDGPAMFRGRLNLKEVGAMGHSFGGSAAAEFCQTDSRCKAGIDIDGRIYGELAESGVRRPFMWLNSDHSREADAESDQIRAQLKQSYDHSGSGRLSATLVGSGHFSFSDLCLLMDLPAPARSGPFGQIDPRRGLLAASECIGCFFDIHLKHRPASEFKKLYELFHEVKQTD